MKKVYKAHILFTKVQSHFEVFENGYVAVDDRGRVTGVANDLADLDTEGAEIVDFGNRLLIPAMNDMHVHAPQVHNQGVAMDLELLGEHLNALLRGEEVQLPRYDFKQGRPFFDGPKMSLDENDILVMEGIHALDPAMVPSVDQSRIYRIYASALTSLKLDENCCISTTDNRLLRRMIRDNRVRGISPEDTILRWPSVRKGERQYIFPFQENADSQFNTALLYELPVLRYYAEPLLRRIHPSSAAYPEARRLLKFLDYIVALTPEEIATIPPTSLIREFIGGQTLTRSFL